MQQMVSLLQILLLAKRVSGTTMPIIRGSRVSYRWLLPVVFGAVVFKLLVWCGAEGYVSGLRDAAAAATTHSSTPDQQLENHSTKHHRQQPLYNTLELLIMGIVVSEKH